MHPAPVKSRYFPEGTGVIAAIDLAAFERLVKRAGLTIMRVAARILIQNIEIAAETGQQSGSRALSDKFRREFIPPGRQRHVFIRVVIARIASAWRGVIIPGDDDEIPYGRPGLRITLFDPTAQRVGAKARLQPVIVITGAIAEPAPGVLYRSNKRGLERLSRLQPQAYEALRIESGENSKAVSLVAPDVDVVDRDTIRVDLAPKERTETSQLAL